MERQDAEDEVLIAGLQKRDRAFLLRLLLRFSVVALFAVWGVLMLDDVDVGGCAARGFGTMTETP